MSLVSVSGNSPAYSGNGVVVGWPGLSESESGSAPISKRI